MQFAHIANYPHFKFVPIPNLPPFQIRHVTIHPHYKSPPCYNLPPFQIHPCYKSPYAVACVFPQIANITNSPPLQIAHVFNCPHVEGLIAISPYMGVIRTFANIRVNTKKRHHGHGMGSFACVVGANCNSPILQIALCCCVRFFLKSRTLYFAPIPNRPSDKKLKKSFLL